MSKITVCFPGDAEEEFFTGPGKFSRAQFYHFSLFYASFLSRANVS